MKTLDRFLDEITNSGMTNRQRARLAAELLNTVGADTSAWDEYHSYLNVDGGPANEGSNPKHSKGGKRKR